MNVFLGSPLVDGDDDIDDFEDEFEYIQGNGNPRDQWQGEDSEISSSSRRHESKQSVLRLTHGQHVSNDL